jgi:predicted lipoprotein with Yx(FWY)xxD motif
MKRNYILLAAALVGAASCSTVASAQSGGSSAHSARTFTVQLRHTSLGTILSSSSGSTLYLFTRDHASANSCVKVSGCPAAWPALEVSGSPTAGPGVQASLLSTIRLPGGGKQVVYAGHPLYLFSDNEKPGSVSYVGITEFGGEWEALNAAGRSVK